jgi:prepilin-type N-terminal cleavage/methylation domain-containing protein
MTNDSKQGCSMKNTRGFTLIEILIAVAIFSIGILAVAKMQLWTVKNTTTGNLTTMATMLGRAQIEELKGVANVTTLTDGADPNNPIDADGNPGGICTRQWTVTNPLGGSDTRRIDVEVSWSRQGQNRSVVLTTITRGNGT